MIAINKLGSPGREDDAERGAVDPLARHRARVAAADRADRGDARRERPRALGEDRGASRATSRSRGSSRSGARAISPARCSPSRRRARSSIWSRLWPTIPSCGACSTRCSAASSTRSAQSVRSWRRCSDIGRDGRQRPALPEIEAARARLDGVARVTPVYRSETLVAARRPRGAAEGGEPPAHRLVQGPRRVQPHLDSERRGARGGRRRGERRQPRPGGRVGGARGRRARAHLHAAGRADGEGRRDTPLRRRDRADRLARSRTALDAAQRVRRGDTARRSCIRSRTRS